MENRNMLLDVLEPDISPNVYVSEFQQQLHFISKQGQALLLLEQMVEFQQDPVPAQLSLRN